MNGEYECLPSAPVGVMDSGVGGLSTLGSIIRELPNEDLLFFGDTANAPYGTKPREEVLRHVNTVVDTLLRAHCKAVVLACNTATAVAAADLRARLTLPVIGIEPALKPASALRHGGQVLVLATPVTLALPKFGALMERYGEGAVRVPCPGLMELVEREDFASAREYLQRVLSGFDPETVDAVVLGCTHYVFLRPVLREILPERAAIVDGNEGTARQLRRVLEQRGLLNPQGTPGKVILCTSGDENRVLPVMKRLLARA